MKKIFLLIAACLAFAGGAAAQSPPWTGIIDPARAIDWSEGFAGVPGGIPSATWTQCGSTVAAGTSAATINSLLAACPANTYLLLGAGTFNLSNNILFFGISHVVLRGSGANQTFLVFSGQTNCNGQYTDICLTSSDNNYNFNVSNASTWTAGYSKCTSPCASGTITLAPAVYNSAVAYNHGMTVSSGGVKYQCITADQNVPPYAAGCVIGNSPPSSAWQTVTSDVPNLKVGYSIILDQIDESNTPGDAANNDIFVCGVNQNVCTQNGDTGDGHRTGPTTTNWRGQQQNVTVTQCDGVSTVGHACTSGANITISPGLYMPNWCPEGVPCATTQPGAWWPTTPAIGDGVENLSMDNSFETNQYATAITPYNCQGCWVKGIRSIQAGRSHIAPNFSPHIQIQDSYFWRTFSQTSVSYGLDINNSGDCLLVNNIFEAVTFSIPFNGNGSGCVVAYNFSVNQWYTTGCPSCSMLESIGLHSEGDDTILIEGNQVNEFNGDDTHGTHNMVTIFRNAFAGYQQNGGSLPTNGLNAYLTRSFNRFFNVIGNVFGNSYSQTYNYTGVNGVPIIQSQGGGNGPPDDLFTHTSAFVYNNWDPVSASGGATRTCGNSGSTGWGPVCGGGSATAISSATESGHTATYTSTLNPPTGSSAVVNAGNSLSGYNEMCTPATASSSNFTCPLSRSGLGTGTGGNATYGTEVPTATFKYPNAIPASTTMPASFIYLSKPAWWPSGKPWPLQGPDVTSGNLGDCHGGTYAAAYMLSSSACTGAGGTFSTTVGLGGHVNSTPALDCYLTTMGGSPIGTDSSALTFNPSACYSLTGSVSLSPSSNNFGSVNVGSSSSPVTWTLTNGSSTTMTGVSISNVGGNSGDFAISSNTCTSTLAASGSCTLVEKFNPSAAGSRSTTLTVTYSGGDGASPQTSALSGTGVSVGVTTPTTINNGTRISNGTVIR